MGRLEAVDREFLYIEFCLVPRNSTRRRPAPAPQESVDNLVADVLQWQKEIGEARLPEQSAKASAKESNLAKRWSKFANRPDISAEDLAKLQSVPAPAPQGPVDKVVADVWTILAPSWAILAPSWLHLGPSGLHLGSPKPSQACPDLTRLSPEAPGGSQSQNHKHVQKENQIHY